MKLEVGMYIRTPYGIDKIKDIVLNGNLYEDSGLYLEKGIKLVCGKEEMKNLKASHNIIDLIGEGDILKYNLKQNGYLKKGNTMIVIKKINDYRDILDIKYRLSHDKIKLLSIVTKEQFESMSYKVGDK